ncbi:hypothetical protein [Gracilimonas sp. BCB1]|uniref:hypothetical protein n=1 Tax=Gracilimonas sp. BCB1 TaxID=3152362 RepID=UPI0032D9088E
MSDIKIDEDNHRLAPSFIERIKHTIISAFLGAIVAQVIAWLLGFRSIVLWYDELPFLIFAGIFGILGFIFGERFIETLTTKINDW